jgi:hypothetical protein
MFILPHTKLLHLRWCIPSKLELLETLTWKYVSADILLVQQLWIGAANKMS